MPTIGELVDKNVDIGIVLDESGSMDRIKNQTINSFNDFLKEQKQLGNDAYFTFVKFSDEPVVMQKRVKIENAKDISDKKYSPNSVTALFDAIYDCIKTIEKENKNNKVIIAIITDGYENASKRCNIDSVRELIKAKESLGWKFLFLAANIDVDKTTSALGISSMRAVAFDATENGIKNAYNTYGASVTCYRNKVRGE